MNTKTFAQQSRNILLEGVSKKLMYWGFDEKGNASVEPSPISGGYTFRGEVFDDPSVPQLWRSLQNAIQVKGIDVVLEEAAYTWFNRIMALRILAKNGYEEPQLENARGLEHTPLILQRACQGQMSFLTADEQARLRKIINDYTKDQEAFAILLVGYCHSHTTLQRVFGRIDDYTELLLPGNMLQNDGFLHLLNTTDAISDEEYKEVELIGWLYQFYISEKKDDVFKSFKKGKKAEAKDIPAATQIFTPNWIVKYMVENTAGKIWLDKHPNSSLKAKMKYLVTNDSDVIASEAKQSLINNVEELTLIDPACGSGHILVEGFDLIYQMYMEEYYAPEEAVESILQNNLYGLDIDDRAAQLANFAVLLKAAKVYPKVWDTNWLPHIYAMPEANAFSEQEVKDFLGEDGSIHVKEVYQALELMQDAKNLGSVMKLSLSQEAVAQINKSIQELADNDYRDFNLEGIYKKLQRYIPVLNILVKQYTSVVANPPYMGQKNMNADLKSYVNKNYPRSKSDLFAVFMESTLAMTVKSGLMGMINQHSWMFLSSYEKFRNHLLENFGIVNMLHLGPRTFEELSGEVVQSTSFVLSNGREVNQIATYYRLVEFKNIHSKEEHFLKRDNEYLNISQSNFTKISGNPIAYWISERTVLHFNDADKIFSFFDSGGRIKTHGNLKYLRYFWETSKNEIGIHTKKWMFVEDGGDKRKWYGNRYTIVDWSDAAVSYYDSHGGLSNSKFWKREGITWAMTSGRLNSFRFKDACSEYTSAAPTIFPKDSFPIYYMLAFLNSKYASYLLDVMNPTLSTTSGNVCSLPIILNYDYKDIVNQLSKKAASLTKFDWDSRETSWDFEKSPLLNESVSITQAYQTWQEQVTKDFFQLHANEEELNRIFIDIYGLQEELTPEVPLKDITILQEELYRNALEALEPIFREQGAAAIELPIDKAEVISQFVSYCIGLFMGRYRLDKKGLHIAHPNPSQEEIASYTYNGKTITIDEDAILPLMGSGCNFKDDVLQQIYGVLDAIWGSETRTENINFIQECLNKDLEKFLVKDFYKYHCGMYKKKPIYWLFASPKGAFQVLVYMHRMNAFTVEKIRDNYLLEHIKNLESEISLLESNELNLNTQERKKLEQLRKDLAECRDYEVELKDMADKQITFDLDDGVTENYKLFEGVVAKIR